MPRDFELPAQRPFRSRGAMRAAVRAVFLPQADTPGCTRKPAHFRKRCRNWARSASRDRRVARQDEADREVRREYGLRFRSRLTNRTRWPKIRNLGREIDV